MGARKNAAAKMKILFLDIDGVCNSMEYMNATGDRDLYSIDPAAAARVGRIIEQTKCKVVLSSSWRLSAESSAEVIANVCMFIDITPDFHGTTDRGCEVIAWLKSHPEVTRHAILDDNADFHRDQPLFKTTWAAGLTDEIADLVIAHLNKP